MNWTVIRMIVNPSEGSYANVVVTVSWACSSTQVINNVSYTGEIANSTTLPAPQGSFTPYNQLTQNQVLGWVWANGVDKAGVEAQVNQQIQNQATLTPPLPWAN